MPYRNHGMAPRAPGTGAPTPPRAAKSSSIFYCLDLILGQAYDRIVAAQQANEWDMGGHAAHAKELLDQANHEIKIAAEAANGH